MCNMHISTVHILPIYLFQLANTYISIFQIPVFVLQVQRAGPDYPGQERHRRPGQVCQRLRHRLHPRQGKKTGMEIDEM